MGTIEFEGRVVGRFDLDKGEVTEGEPVIQSLWNRFKAEGVVTTGPSPSTDGEKILADGRYVSFEFGMFLWQIQKSGYSVKVP